jgi:N-acetylmuramoyl-L-alanine amidase
MATYSISQGNLKIDGANAEQILSTNTGGKFAKKPGIVVIHFTAGGTARSSAEWFRSPQNRNSSAHVVIERDGTIIQCVNFEKIAWHAGRSSWHGLIGLNQYSIGIELANWGNLRSADGGWVTSTGKRIAEPFLGTHRNGNPDGSTHPIGWEPYPEEQVAAARGLVEALIGAYAISEIVGHDDIAPVRKSDPGPAFNMSRFRTALLNPRNEDGDNTGTVASANGLNLRSGPGTHFPAIVSLKNKTVLQLLGNDGVWLQVTSLDGQGRPDKTGWVHSHYVRLG